MKLKLLKVGVLIFIILCLGSSFLFAQEGSVVDEGAVESGTNVIGVKVEGNQIIETKKILEQVLTQPGDALVKEKVKSDVKAIYALGYFSDVNLKFEKFKKGVKVIFKVLENPVLNSIAVSGNTVYSTAELLSVMQSRVGQILEYTLIREDKEKIEQLYHKDGYLLAKVVSLDTQSQTGALKIELSEGIVEEINLTGNETTQPYVIMRELLTVVGRPLNEVILKNDLRRVFNLGYFKNVTPVFEAGSTPDKVILNLHIEESRTGALNFGGGFGDREGWFGFMDLSVDNLWGSGQGVLLRGQFGQQLSTYQLRYFYPWLWPDRLGERVSFTGRRWYTIGRDIFTSTQDEIRNGWELALAKPFSEYVKGSVSIGSENVAPTRTSTFEPYLSNTVGLSLSFDTRDNFMNPLSGDYNTITLRQGWKYVQSQATTFNKYMLDLNRFIPIFAENQTLALHLGTGVGFGDVPSAELFWCGGPNTVRGYYLSETRLGTRKLISNIEYRYNFNEVFQGVIFYDLGNVWSSGYPVLEDFLSGKGVGIRFNTPLGPIRLDYGIGKYRDFSQGVTHFSIGQAF
jgi:outer membrane protein insertion porin family